MIDENNVYNSGLNSSDWIFLRDVIWPFIHAEDAGTIDVPDAPTHLKEHELIKAIIKYKETGNEKFLDQAGQILIPSKEPFGWYVPLTK